MDQDTKSVLKLVGFEFNDLKDINGLIIEREILLSDNKYDEIKGLLPELKKKYSSSFMTSLQKNADKSQKWPLLNFVRQILNTYGYKMEPIRKSDGYTLEGIKKYKRYFQIKIKTKPNNLLDKSQNDTKIIILDKATNNENIEELF
jgi:hypothetical protein